MQIEKLAPDTQVQIKDFETSEVKKRRGIVALSASHIRRLEAQGLFPQSKNIRGTRMKVYRAGDIVDWVNGVWKNSEVLK